MRKMRLALDDLAVETFAPDGRAARRGTVGAHESTMPTEEWVSCGIYTGCGAGCHEMTEVHCDSAQICTGQTEYGVRTCEPYASCVGTTCEYPICTHPGEGC